MKFWERIRALSGSPILWGLLGSAGFYYLVHRGPLATPFIERYFTHHPVEYGETVLFAIGLAALVIRMIDVAGQYAGLRQSPLGAPTRGTPSTDEQCQLLLGRLTQLPRWRQGEYYVRRLRAVLERVQRLGSVETLDDELKYLADVDATRLHNGYALFRVIVWAIPILGFLGTVIGITMALNGLRPEALDESMLQVTTGLGVKFDTTALALAMSMLLMFIHFFVDRAENSLLEQVDEHVEADLASRFQRIPTGPDGQVMVIRQMAEDLVQALEQQAQRQTELWQASMEAAAARWSKMADDAGKQVKKAVTEGLAEALREHAQHLAAAEQAVAKETHQHWDKLRHAETQNVEALAGLQAQMVRQSETLKQTLEATGQVTQLQDVLNRNLAALAGSKHIEQTVSGLAAAIHLLNARLAESPTAAPSYPLPPSRSNAHAA
jgi:biopolymer transport protein ExbB/TolQ